MKLFSRHKMIITGVFALFCLVFVYVFQDWKAEEKSYLDSHVREMERSVHGILSAYEKMADLIVHTQVETPRVGYCMSEALKTDMPAFRDLLRNSLLERLTPLYREMVLIGFRQFHFHFPDNTSFLRFHRPEKYGDDLSGIRQTVSRTNRERVKTVGFEEGRALNGYRFVYPLFFQDRHVGSVEASISFLPVVRELSAITEESGIGSATFLLVREDKVRDTVWVDEQSRYIPSKLSDRYLVDAEVSVISGLDRDSVCESIRDRAVPLLEVGEPFALHASIPGCGSFLVEFLPEKNIDGEVLGYLGHLHQDRRFNVLRRFFLLRVLSLGLLTALVMFFLLYRHRLVSRLQAMATTDPLTRALNRRALLDSLKQRIYLVERYSRSCSLIMFDVDHFKGLNDTFGHSLGDGVLVEITRICRSELRDSDLLARWGGDEFVILLAESDAEKAGVVAERIRKRVYDRFVGEEYTVTLSLGVYQIPLGETDPDPLFAQVDAALYRAKEKGRNRVEVAVTETVTEH